ncbi:MAG: histidine kinase N-terminal 7TM domain-containing protein, partial [Chloroflexota bacterium]
MSGALITINQILMAGVAVTAFSLLLYSLTFNLRDRVARSFAMILFCLVIIYSAESLASVAPNPPQLDFWLRLQWIGIVIIPAAYLHFSDALLATTGKPSRGKRRWAIRLSYLIALLF